LARDYFAIPEDDIKNLYAMLTVVDGRVVHAAENFKDHGPPALPISPDWSPIARFGGAHQVARFNPSPVLAQVAHGLSCAHGHHHGHSGDSWVAHG
jgi:hypothetical protein